MTENTEPEAALARRQGPIGGGSGERRWRLDAISIGPGAFRFLLAGLVFVSHVTRFNVGRVAVVIFFMLSGYWVARLFKQRRLTVPAYLLDRFLRIWPLLALASAIVLAANLLLGRHYPGELLDTVLLLGLASRETDLLGVTWSLDIEAQFYIALPLAWAIASAAGMQWRSWTAVLAIALLTAVGTLLAASGIVTVLAYAPCFAAGAAIANLRPSWNGKWAALSALLFVALLAVVNTIPGFEWALKGPRAEDYDLMFAVASVALVPFIAWNVNQPSSPMDRHLGNLSFPLYLIHYPVIAITIDLFGDRATTKLLALAISLALMLLLYVWFDRPLEKVRHMVARRMSARAAEGRDGAAAAGASPGRS